MRDPATTLSLPGIDIVGPVQAEVFVVWLNDDRLELSGPCGAAPWLVEVGSAEHPLDVVASIVRDALGPPILVHSTSWRHAGARGAVILTFVVAVAPDQVASFESLPVGRAALARSGATAAPAVIAHEQVLEHAVRHLAWLVREDETVAAALPPRWHGVLAAWIPEPFRNLG